MKTAKVAQLPGTAVEKLAEAEAALEVKLPQGSITIDAETLAEISKQAGGDVELSIVAVDKSELNAQQQTAVGDAPVYDVSIQSGGSAITDFGGGSATIELPYELKEGELPNGILIYSVDDDGNLEKVSATYDAGTVSFDSSPCAKYAIAYDLIAAWENPFGDVAENDWYYGDTAYAAQLGLFSGMSDTEFAPNSEMTRSMLVTVLYRLAGEPDVSGLKNPFDDVSEDEWHTNAVIWAESNGIVSGYGDKLFGTNDAVSRQDLCVMLLRYAEWAGITLAETLAERDFADASEVSNYAKDAVMALYRAGVIEGEGDGVFDPNGSATRSAVAAVLHRFLER